MQFSTIFIAALAAISTEAATMSCYASTNYGGKAFATSGTGTFPLGFTAASYKFSSGFADGICVKTCAGGRETGSFCKGRSNANVASGNRFNKIVIGKDSTVLNC
ncbi:hypothetical protein EJ05DRAFT_506336 [Pseudovirgaria hyperparasitica]|uniref:Uncharacterized protein n=1 Tax=Pseudovirgaria hyperparasitica TaxID=470096 RepID=A0A6A6WKF6_9PEZI|nr:uncharacterized protein EJ05DRAFT_506336 [Pseudovirgaria hyperparasitica]KAF2762633.1 hypothetical protein EJ05DRAFT_506336 [Pseudovirgaria hyperparasitica]